MALGDAVREYRGLDGEVSILVVGVGRGPCESTFQAGAGAEHGCSWVVRFADDRGVELERVLEREVDELEIVLGHSRPRLLLGVVLGQDPQCLRMVGDHAAPDLRDLLAELLGRQDP